MHLSEWILEPPRSPSRFWQERGFWWKQFWQHNFDIINGRKNKSFGKGSWQWNAMAGWIFWQKMSVRISWVYLGHVDRCITYDRWCYIIFSIFISPSTLIQDLQLNLAAWILIWLFSLWSGCLVFNLAAWSLIWLHNLWTHYLIFNLTTWNLIWLFGINLAEHLGFNLDEWQ